jgi:acyl-[acyl-carrier-protein]-phospholipid O-acyltransferase / long-chain-fatty-acid--[acyl-carrier-protein] ligase
VLLTEEKAADRNALIAWGKANGVAELTLPRRVVVVDAIPVLGTGKTDYVAAQRMAEGQLAAAA